MSGARLPIRGGAFVAIVGPSGSGKDSVMRFARKVVEREAPGRFHFARRLITRPADDGAEAHDSCSPERFTALREAGAFSFSWQAHDCSYAVPSIVDEIVGEGGVAVANLSRAVLGEVRARYERTFIVEITAPLAVLAQRIAGRGRESDAAIEARLARSTRFRATQISYDLIIDNSGPLEEAGARLVDALRTLAPATPNGAPA